ncbi:MAG: hypothetical protein N4A47_01660 [Clostridia bacterium]|nr:hypothetical protein [Clostridia bacterium]
MNTNEGVSIKNLNAKITDVKKIARSETYRFDYADGTSMVQNMETGDYCGFVEIDGVQGETKSGYVFNGEEIGYEEYSEQRRRITDPQGYDRRKTLSLIDNFGYELFLEGKISVEQHLSLRAMDDGIIDQIINGETDVETVVFNNINGKSEELGED